MNTDQNLKPLRRTITPYIGHAVILVGITVLMAFSAYKVSDWKFFWESMGLLWPLFALAYLYFGLQYKVLWNGDCVVMRASGGPEKRVAFDDISSIGYETAVSQSKPFRRLVIHGPKQHPKEFVDVSLRHFRLEDIQELMTAIHVRRPDLAIPKAPAGLETPPTG